jgi:hypothetical protein
MSVQCAIRFAAIWIAIWIWEIAKNALKHRPTPYGRSLCYHVCFIYVQFGVERRVQMGKTCEYVDAIKSVSETKHTYLIMHDEEQCCRNDTYVWAVILQRCEVGPYNALPQNIFTFLKYLAGYNSMQSVQSQPMFRRNIPHPSSESALRLVSCSAEYLALKIEAKFPSEMSIDFLGTKWYCISEWRQFITTSVID